MTVHVNSGYSRSLITQLGQTVTLTTETVTVDHNTDWDDETYTEEQDTDVKAIVDTPRGATVSRSEVSRGIDADRIVWLRDDVDHDIRDGTGDATATRVTIGGVVYAVQQHEDRGTGVIRLEVGRV